MLWGMLLGGFATTAATIDHAVLAILWPIPNSGTRYRETPWRPNGSATIRANPIRYGAFMDPHFAVVNRYRVYLK